MFTFLQIVVTGNRGSNKCDLYVLTVRAELQCIVYRAGVNSFWNWI